MDKELRIERFPLINITGINNGVSAEWNLYTGNCTNWYAGTAEELGKKYQYFNISYADLQEKHILTGLSVQYDKSHNRVCMSYCFMDISGFCHVQNNTWQLPQRRWQVYERIYLDEKGLVTWHVNKEGVPLVAVISQKTEHKDFLEGEKEEYHVKTQKPAFLLYHSWLNFLFECTDVFIGDIEYEYKKHANVQFDGTTIPEWICCSGNGQMFEWFQPFRLVYGSVCFVKGKSLLKKQVLSDMTVINNKKSLMQVIMDQPEPSMTQKKIVFQKQHKNGKSSLIPEENGILSEKEDSINNSSYSDSDMQKLVQIPISDVLVPADVATQKEWRYVTKEELEQAKKFAVVQKIKWNRCCLSVVRLFALNFYEDIPVEALRIYISEEKEPLLLYCLCGKYRRLTTEQIPFEFFDSPLEMGKKDIVKTPFEKYFVPLTKIPRACRMAALASFLQYPFTERLFKMEGMKDIMNAIFRMASVDTPTFYLSALFDVPEALLQRGYYVVNREKKETTVYQMLGFNKYQLSKLLPLMKENFLPQDIVLWHERRSHVTRSLFSVSALFRMSARILCGESCVPDYHMNHIDNKTTDLIIPVVKGLVENSHLISIREIHTMYRANKKQESNFTYNYLRGKQGLQSVLEMIRDKWGRQALESVMKSMAADQRILHPHYLWLYYDALSFLPSEITDFKPFITSIDDVMNMHQRLIDVQEEKKKKDIFRPMEIENWKRKLPSWEKYLFETEHYKIVLPQHPLDLVEEGTALKHCVGTYVKRILNGETNVVFLRKTESLDEPFFTIEIDNNDCIQQVHGFDNCNADTDVLQFVKEWSEKKNFFRSNINKSR